MSSLASALTGVAGERVALCDVSVSATLQDLLAEVTVAQTYRNDERVNIEAVYTFPLPLDAVLLELEVEIGGRVLKGIVVEKKTAETSYEDVVAAGDAAVMLEAIEPGLYTMNVGNLLPQETAKITFTYAILYRWTGDRLRFFLPTTVAPRFGISPHLPHQVPQESLTVENQFSLRLEIFGSLRNAQFVCPSHTVELVTSPEKAVLSLQQPKAVMDRDFIVNVRAPQATRSFVLCGQDGEGLAALASFQPFFPGLRQPRALKLAIVIDCSGSMQGDSMGQARQALEGILGSLEPHDLVTLIAFGNSTKESSDQLLPCNGANIAMAKRFAQELDANMGGTEIGKALRKAYSVIGSTGSADIFLVTDGEVSGWESVVLEAQKSGNRLFTVGVGSAVSEAFVRGLAAATGGECELVSPREDMADRVVRHFERMRAPRAKRVAVRWPEGALESSPSAIDALFEGDTVVASARFERVQGDGSVTLEVETETGEIVVNKLPMSVARLSASVDGLSTVARLAAASRLKALGETAGLSAALQYRLVSPWTNWLVVAPRPEDEKAYDLPILRKVPQTLAAGWGGMGSVSSSVSMSIPVGPALRRPGARPAMSKPAAKKPAAKKSAGKSREWRGDAYEASERSAYMPASFPDLQDSHRRLLLLINADPSRLDEGNVLELLQECGLGSEFDDLLRRADDLEINLDTVAAIVLARVLGGPLGQLLSSRAQGSLALLQNRAQRAAKLLQAIGRHGAALARATQDRMAREVLRREVDEEVLKRFAEFRQFLEELEEAMHRLPEPIQQPEN